MAEQSFGGAAAVEHGAYTIRPYHPSDAEGVRALFEAVWGTDRSAEWVAHRYEANPYLDGPSMIVAATDGRIVGARPFIPLPLRVGDTDTTAVYLGNVMVHPEHRRQGLFSRMTEVATEAYADSDSAFFFNFANEQSAPGYRKLGFREVGIGPEKHLRIQRPGALLRDRTELPVGGFLAGLADEAAAAVLSRWRGQRTIGRWRVERHSGVPADLLAGLYDSADHPAAIHTRREEALYRWLGNSPYWQYETYVASTDERPAAAVVLRQRSERPDRDVRIVDALPPGSRDHREAFRALLDVAIADHRDARVVSAVGPVVTELLLPDETLREFGFLSSTLPVLSRTVGRDDTVFVYVLGENATEPPRVGGVDLREPENWALEVR